MTSKIVNREHWLERCVAALRPILQEAGETIDAPVRIACGFPSRNALSRRRRTIGQCFATSVSADKTAEIFISPLVADPVEVAAVVAHELIHAAGHDNHKPAFLRVARKLGLDGPATATVPGEAFKQRIAPALAKLGDYPHAAMNLNGKIKKQTTRLLKVECMECDEEGEPYIVRMSARTLNASGPPICPLHNRPMSGDAIATIIEAIISTTKKRGN